MIAQKYLRYITLFASIITLILGIVVMCQPLDANIVVNYLLVLGLGICGISDICRFASTRENGAWDLIIGILCLVACMVLLANGALILEVTMGYVLAIIALISGIGRFFMAASAHKAGLPMGGLICSGIIMVLLGICLICLPIATQVIYTYVAGIFMVVGGVVGIINAFSISTKEPKAKASKK